MPDDGQLGHINYEKEINNNAFFEHAKEAAKECDFVVVQNATLTYSGEIEMSNDYKKLHHGLAKGTHIADNKMLVGVSSDVKSFAEASFGSTVKAVESLTKLLGSVGGLFFAPEFLQENSVHFDMFPFLIAKLRHSMNKRRRTKHKKIVVGFRSENVAELGGWSDENSAVDLLYFFSQSNKLGHKQQTLFVPEFPMFNASSLALQNEEFITSRVLLNKIVIGLDSHGAKIEPNDPRTHHQTVEQLCKSINTGGKIIYDRTAIATTILKGSEKTDFIWPNHESLITKIGWIKEKGFLGVGLSSMSMDYDQFFTCRHNGFRFPLHSTVSILLGLDMNSVHVNAKKRMGGPLSRINSGTSGQQIMDKKSRLSARSLEQISEPTMCKNLCGVRQNFALTVLREAPLPPATANTRTFGGHTLTTHFYPWVVFVKAAHECKNGENLFISCTGFLVSMRHVATAAHCVHWKKETLAKCDGRASNRTEKGYKTVKPSELFISYGSYNIETTWTMGAEEISIPHNFRPESPEPRQHDFAIIHLSHALDKLRNVAPICISKSTKLWHGQMATVVGRGNGERDAIDGNKKLNEALVPIVSSEYCQGVFHGNRIQFNGDDFLCAGSKNRGILPGDCGAPLFVERAGLFYAVGLALSSFSPASMRGLLPDVFVSVSEHCDFIERSTAGEVSCLDQEYSESEVKAKCAEKFKEILFENYQATCASLADDDDDDGERGNACLEPVGQPEHN